MRKIRDVLSIRRRLAQTQDCGQASGAGTVAAKDRRPQPGRQSTVSCARQR